MIGGDFQKNGQLVMNCFILIEEMLSMDCRLLFHICCIGMIFMDYSHCIKLYLLISGLVYSMMIHLLMGLVILY
jgi:hypothetical protein